MPNRIRIILRGDGVRTGKLARIKACELVSNHWWKNGTPMGWIGMTYMQKAKVVKTLLPPGWVLELFIEPKATRQKRSAFKQGLLKKPKDLNEWIAEGAPRRPRANT